MVTTVHEISQISSNSMQWNLKVRVVRMWELPDRFNPGKPYSIELILQDAKGDRIQASIEKYVIKFFRTKIQEPGLYHMNYFVIVPNNLSLKNTPHNLRLTFTQRTTVEEIVDSSFHMNIFNFRRFDQLTNQNDLDEAELFDVIGQVVTYEDVKTHKQGDNDSVFLNVQLEDDQRNKITATIWSELVDQIQPYLNEDIDEPLIVVLQFMKPQKFRGNYSVRSCWYSTKLWINSTLPQYVEFKSRIVATCPSKCERITQTSEQQIYSVRDELAKGIISFKTIMDLVQCGEECTYWIAAKVVNLELERGWSYLACNMCTKKVDKIGNKFFCEKCNEEQHSVGLRYRLQDGVIDGTAFISLLLWNREAMQIIRKSAKELKQGLVEASVKNDDCSYPSELDDILYKKFMFKIIVKSSNIEKKDKVYIVVKITDDYDLLKEYCHSSLEDTFSDSEIPNGQISGREKLESPTTSTSQTPINKSISECGSTVVEDGDDWKAKISPIKTYDKRTRSSNKASGVVADDDMNFQLSTNKVRKVIKKEKNP